MVPLRTEAFFQLAISPKDYIHFLVFMDIHYHIDSSFTDPEEKKKKQNKQTKRTLFSTHCFVSQ